MPGAPEDGSGGPFRTRSWHFYGLSAASRSPFSVSPATFWRWFPRAVNTAVDAFRNRTGLEITVKNALIGVELSSNDQIHFIQILREALANVEKHARATKVEVCIERAPDGACTMQVVDNGVGIPEHAEKENHFGLSIMKERAAALGAVLSISRRPEGGTIVFMSRPPQRAHYDDHESHYSC